MDISTNQNSSLNVLQAFVGRPLIVSHRGHFGGNIVQNTLAAFQNAIRHGADVIEMDLISSNDGELYCFHDGYEKLMFGTDEDLRNLSSQEIQKLPTYNSIYEISGYGATRFLDVADSLLEKSFINLDRCWDFLDTLLPQLNAITNKNKILLKTPVKKEWLQQIETLAPGIPYMPILKSLEEFRLVETYNINLQAVELIFPSLDHELVQLTSLQEFQKKELLPFVNAIDLGKRFNLSASLTDTGAILESDENHWGKLVDMGFLMIQTDWPLLLHQFLTNRMDRMSLV